MDRTALITAQPFDVRILARKVDIDTGVEFLHLPQAR
jgi:hypothetical protein